MSLRVRVGPFELEHRLGSGGMAEVWRARHIALDEPVAIKVVHARLAADRRYVERFWREIVAMARLEHPGIVEVLDAGVVPPEIAEAAGVGTLAGSPWLAMPLSRDGTLGASPPRSWDELAPTLFTLLDALGHAHARGVLHRDLKPANVLRDLSGPGPARVRIADFGLAHALGADSDLDDLHGPRGTPVYMAPEQFHHDAYPVGPWSDLYAVGVMTWELVTGERPFGVDDAEAVLRAKRSGAFVPFRPLFAVPRALDVWLQTLMQPDPSRRFRRAASASAALRAVLTGQPPYRMAGAVPPGPRMPGSPVVDLDADAAEGDAPLPVPARAAPETLSTGSPLRGLGLFSLRRAPVTGRGAERAALWDALRAVANGAPPQVVIVRGPGGVGRHRLAEWLAEHAHASGVAEVIRADGADGGDLLGRAIAAHLRVDAVPGGLRLNRLEAWCAVHRRVAGGLDARELHAILPGAGAPALTQPVALIADERFAVFERVLRALADGRVTLLVVQRATRASGRAVAELIAGWSSGPLLVVACEDADPDALTELEGREGSAVIDLDRLPASALRASIRAMIPLDPALEKQIIELADGIPSVATVLLRQLVARGDLEPAAGGYRLVAHARIPLLEDAAAVALARFEEVERRFAQADRRAVRHMLELAAVLGPDVAGAEWAEACRRAALPPRPRLVEFLERAGLARVTDTGWRFVHAGYAMALRESARVGGRDEAWALVGAEAVSASAPDGSFRVAGRVGRLLLQGGNPLAAIDLLHMAGVGAVWRGDTTTAWDVLADRDRAMDAVGLPAASRERVDSALLRAWCAVLESRISLASAAADEAAAGARAGGYEDVLGGVATVRGVTALHRDRPTDAIPWFDEAVARFDTAGDRDWRRRAQAWSAWTRLTVGRLPEAWTLAHAVLCEGADPRETASLRARLVACRVAIELGHSDVARRWLDEVRRTLNEGIYAGPLRARAEQLRGVLALERGDRVAAWRAFSRARRYASAASSPEGRLARFELAALALDAGRTAEAERRLRVLALERPFDAGLGPWIATARAVASPHEPEHERRLTTVEAWLTESRGGTRRLAALAHRATILLPSGPIATAARSVERLAQAAVDRQALIVFDPTV